MVNLISLKKVELKIRHLLVRQPEKAADSQRPLDAPKQQYFKTYRLVPLAFQKSIYFGANPPPPRVIFE